MAFIFKKKKIEPPQFTEIGLNSLFTGEINSRNPLYLNGEAEGVFKSEKKIETGENSNLSGKFFSREVVIRGKFSGYSEAEEKLVLAHSAKFDGEIIAKIIKIEKGAVINGKIT